jgi:lysophospholipase L1-like esterase/pimeloyl-ACP methyl ester carboxylesterase
MRFFLFFFLTSLHLAAAPLKVAVIGDSITFGAGAEPRETHRYSTRLGHLLGKDYDVQTFAAGGLCILRKADRPFVKTPHFKKALAFKPDLAVITLGTNDTCQNAKRKNWQNHPDLQADALFIVSELRKANPQVIVHLCTPPPIFPEREGLKPERKTDLLERSKHLTVIHKAYAAAAATDDKLHFHDLSRALSQNNTTDGVHPNTSGHQQLAHHFYDLLSHSTGNRAPAKITSQWNGFDRHNFQLPVTGAKATLVIPHTAAKGQAWIWRARFWGHQPALDLALLDRGYHLAFVDVSNLYGSEAAMKRGEELHHILTTNFKLSQKPILEGMSRGGLFVFNFAAKHPGKVSAIYGDNPVCNFNSWPGGMNGKLSKGDYTRCLAAYGLTADQAKTHPQITAPAFAEKLKGIPVALVIGTADDVVPPSENAELVAANLTKLNSPLKVWRKPGLGHHPHGLSPVEPLLKFLLQVAPK